ncbi:hypothetical protein GALL_543500 [mine drainage metagenome]|uniref:Uncharacterized protein n=1 Tax=mine drainage metagenome TaxID=410659 RepID=A0A1J5P8H1_9ZZZZ
MAAQIRSCSDLLVCVGIFAEMLVNKRLLLWSTQETETSRLSCVWVLQISTKVRLSGPKLVSSMRCIGPIGYLD